MGRVRRGDGMNGVRFIGFRGGIGILMGCCIQLRIGMMIFMDNIRIRFGVGWVREVDIAFGVN
jgi:hypothetical protein